MKCTHETKQIRSPERKDCAHGYIPKSPAEAIDTWQQNQDSLVLPTTTTLALMLVVYLHLSVSPGARHSLSNWYRKDPQALRTFAVRQSEPMLLGQLLAQAGLVSEEQLRHGIQRREATHSLLGESLQLISAGAVSDEILQEAHELQRLVSSKSLTPREAGSRLQRTFAQALSPSPGSLGGPPGSHELTRVADAPNDSAGNAQESHIWIPFS